VLARGRRLQAIREDGIALTGDGGDRVVRPIAADIAQEIGRQDYVFVCVKSYAVAEVAPQLVPLMAEHTKVVFVQNGIPWWYCAGLAQDLQLDCVDSGHRISAAIPLPQVIGCVTYVNARNAGLGLVQLIADGAFVIGAPGGEATSALRRLAAAMQSCGIATRTSERIRDEIWVKLWGSVAFNPISALTGATMDVVITDPATRPLVIAMMGEARAVAEGLGATLHTSLEQRLETALGAGKFKTSMLQDVEAGRRLEIDAIIGAVAEAGHKIGVATPAIEHVLGLLRQKSHCLRLHG
jgi:2-dehydropantoate 2-reductase